MPNQPPTCDAATALVRFQWPLVHVAKLIEQAEALRIVAIGSSSTEGDGASAPDASYPRRLETFLATRLPGQPFTVFNAGKGGQEAPDEVGRFKNDVIERDPTLVI